MKKFIKRLLTNWVLKNYPFKITTKVDKYYTIFVKKGKIREVRTFTGSGARVPVRL